ncbi:MAG: hypothetical protein FWC26_14980 [Fibromonadales bacterium]|nr:hypothetical protein [Fibromonadales bacterium]
MATTVNYAFEEFMNEKVNLSEIDTETAKISREHLIETIHSFSGRNGFYNLANRYDSNFGSFSRKTKIRPLDDIDIIIGLAGRNVSFDCHQWNDIRMKINIATDPLYDSTDQVFSNGYLNSNMVKNQFKKMLGNVSKYYKADIHSQGAAVTLELLSYDWVFDIVPAFYTDSCNGKNGYLIPNGKGNWKFTNPDIEQERITRVNKKHNGNVLNTIRLVKYWNKRAQIPTMSSYVLETMIVDYFDKLLGKIPQWIEQRFGDVLCFIANNIYLPIFDSKGIEGNINTLTWDEMVKIQNRAKSDCEKAYFAIYTETMEKNQQKAINIWRGIFGEEFPTYG